MRLTRSQMRADAAAQIHTDNTATQSASDLIAPTDDRTPLTETGVNTSPIPVADEMPTKKNTKSTRGRKGKAEKTAKATEEEIGIVQEAQVVLEGQKLEAESPEVVETSKYDMSNIITQPAIVNGAEAQAPPATIRLTRRQLAMQNEVASSSESESQSAESEERAEENLIEKPIEQNISAAAQSGGPARIEETSQSGPSENAIGELAPVLTPRVEREALKVRTSPKMLKREDSFSVASRSGVSPARSMMSGSIEAIDALEDALEDMNKEIPKIKVPSEKATKPNQAGKSARQGAQQHRGMKAATSSVKPGLSRASSVRTTSSSRDSSARPRGNGEVIDYLASKRRPVSVSFPTPPPPLKSTKAPTRPVFQLPGEAIAAKLKAQKEERLKREEEDAVRRKEIEAQLKKKEMEARKATAFKARPVPKFVTTPAATVRETKASKARVSSVGVGLPSEGITIASKRASIVGAPSTNKRSSVAISNRPVSMYGSVPSSSSAKDSKPVPTVKLNAPSMLTRTPSLHASRKPVTGASATTTTTTLTKPITAADVAVQKEKGKQVFNRDKQEKEERERLKREKEEAAKQARAAAAERGRQASREWAEKQKKRLMGIAAAAAAGGSASS